WQDAERTNRRVRGWSGRRRRSGRSPGAGRGPGLAAGAGPLRRRRTVDGRTHHLSRRDRPPLARRRSRPWLGLRRTWPASPDDARLLGIAPGDALLRVRRIAVGRAGVPVERSEDRYRGDRTNFAIENDARSAGIVRRLA